jgi:hypothetical protein
MNAYEKACAEEEALHAEWLATSRAEIETVDIDDLFAQLRGGASTDSTTCV